MVDIFGKFRREIYTPSGEKEKQHYRAVLNERGEYYLEPDGIEDWNGYIQSFKESCLIENILKRYTNGDKMALEAAQGFYGDVSEMPTSMQQVLQMVIDGQNLFNALPVETKQAFDNDFNKWFVQTGQPDWFAKMGVHAESPADSEVKEEVKE